MLLGKHSPRQRKTQAVQRVPSDLLAVPVKARPVERFLKSVASRPV